MIKLSASLLALFIPFAALAQQAAMELAGLFGECTPIYAAADDTLTLHESPNLESAQHEIPYREGWKVPYVRSDGLTRVISFGEIELASEETLMNCDVLPENGQMRLNRGDLVTYLYYLGEGFAKVRVRGSECELDIADAKVSVHPDVQPWIKVLYRDGTSPGWLLNNGTQTVTAGLRC